MHCLITSIIIYTISVGIGSAKIESDIAEYFNSDTIKSFQKVWRIHRKGFENSLSSALQESFGYKSLNILASKNDDDEIATAFFLSDKIVDLLLFNMRFRELPQLNDPDVTLQLSMNALHVEAILSKMFVDTFYLLFRNQSQVSYDVDQDPYIETPFSFQQVQDVGKLVIIAEDCSLTGAAIVKLKGRSVDLGHDTFKVSKCKFSVEISDMGIHGSATPPVIAPYFSMEQRRQIQTLMTKPIREELVQKLQAALYSYVNTTAIFGPDLSKYKHEQEEIFKKTADYMNNVVNSMNKMTITENRSTKDLADMSTSVNESYVNRFDVHRVSNLRLTLSDVTVLGLDTAYSACLGGPYRLQFMKISETIRYSSLQVRGNFYYENSTNLYKHSFSAELLDVSANVIVNVNAVKRKEKHTLSYYKRAKTIEFINWRAMEFSISDMELYRPKRIISHAFIASYLANEIPKCIVTHMSDVFVRALKKTYEQIKDDGRDINEDSDQTDNDTVTNTSIESEDAKQSSIENKQTRNNTNNKNMGTIQESDNADSTEKSSEIDQIKTHSKTGSELQAKTTNESNSEMDAITEHNKDIENEDKILTEVDNKKNQLFQSENDEKQLFTDQIFTDKTDKEETLVLSENRDKSLFSEQSFTDEITDMTVTSGESNPKSPGESNVSYNKKNDVSEEDKNEEKTSVLSENKDKPFFTDRMFTDDEKEMLTDGTTDIKTDTINKGKLKKRVTSNKTFKKPSERDETPLLSEVLRDETSLLSDAFRDDKNERMLLSEEKRENVISNGVLSHGIINSDADTRTRNTGHKNKGKSKKHPNPIFDTEHRHKYNMKPKLNKRRNIISQSEREDNIVKRKRTGSAKIPIHMSDNVIF